MLNKGRKKKKEKEEKGKRTEKKRRGGRRRRAAFFEPRQRPGPAPEHATLARVRVEDTFDEMRSVAVDADFLDGFSLRKK